jgi:hypothetical protein
MKTNMQKELKDIRSKAAGIFRRLVKVCRSKLWHKRGHGLPEQKNGFIVIGGQVNGKLSLFCEENIHVATDDSGWIHFVPELEPVMQSEIVMDPSTDLLSMFRDGSHKYN